MAIVASRCVLYLLFCLVTMPAGPITTPDSAHYAPVRELLRRASPNVRAALAITCETCLQGPCADRSRADPGDPIVFTADGRVRYRQTAIVVLGVMTGTLAVVGVIAAVATLTLPPALAIACLAALAAHGGLLVTALLAAGFSRFTIGLWPAITTAALFGAWAVLNANTKTTKTTKENS